MLLAEVKAYLKINWDEEDSDLSKMINRGISRLNKLTGTTLNFDADDIPKELLLDYCRYAYNNALEYFEQNFASDILKLQLEKGIEVMKEESV